MIERTVCALGLSVADDMKPHGASLTRIAEALGLPMSYFYAADRGVMPADERSNPDETAVLHLVKDYLLATDPAARQRFVETVKVIVEGLSP